MDGGASRVSEPSILIGCEYSATVRDAFRAAGFNAWSCDLKPCDRDNQWHFQFDVREAIRLNHWSLILLHLDCTAMAVCGNRHYGKGTPGHAARIEAVRWSAETTQLALQHCDRLAVENPASVLFPALRKIGATVQYIQPWQHGHPEQKKTGLALWNLSQRVETDNVYEYMMTLPKAERERIFHMAPSVDRGHERSRFYTGFAAAMRDQWGPLL